MSSEFYRYIPLRPAYMVTDPIIRVMLRLASDPDESVSYDGRGTVRYAGDDGERQLGRSETALSMFPFFIWAFAMVAVQSFLPPKPVFAPVTIGMVVVAFLTIRVIGEVEFVRSEGGER